MIIVRFAEPTFSRLRDLLFSRYPRYEWATFARFGWRDTGSGLVLTMACLDEPGPGDLDTRVGNVAFQEQYSLRMALAAADAHALAVGVIHSHPKNYMPSPSTVDDDMDAYYARYFGDFAPDRPYVSLILADNDGLLVMTGRVFWRGAWHVVDQVVAERHHLHRWSFDQQRPVPFVPSDRIARLTSLFGEEAAGRLRDSTVAVIGAGGTGSAAIEALARAGVGRLIIVDPETLGESNLERVHGSYPSDAAAARPKVQVARDHVRAINPDISVVMVQGALPQSAVIDTVLGANVVLGCTDQQHSRLAISDLAARFLIPAIDCGVVMEGRGGSVTGQVMQFTWFTPQGPCALCRKLITARLGRELMSAEERAQRRAAAMAAKERGVDGNPYWEEDPQLLTVGYLTTAAGALAAGYAIGFITGRFMPPFSRAQMTIGGKFLDMAEPEDHIDPACSCRKLFGCADQGLAHTLITAPYHWPGPVITHDRV